MPIGFKSCKCCGETKPLTTEHFHKLGDGFVNECKQCRKIKRAAYYSQNKDRELKGVHKWQTKNRERKLLNLKKWHKTNREHCKTYSSLRRQTIAEVRLTNNMSRSIRQSLSGSGNKKNGRPWEELVGYTLEDLRTHLESLFVPGMSWNNYGYGPDKWHIDHCVPASWFVYSSPNDPAFKECWALSNLQPLWQPDNLSKQHRFAHLRPK